MSSVDSGQQTAMRKSKTSGAKVYEDYSENFVVWPGREDGLKRFVNQTYGGQRHKLQHSKSSNSEDALTWSCFDTLNCLSIEARAAALRELWSCAFDGRTPSPSFYSAEIHVGKKYGSQGEETEVDASIEANGLLIFLEAKLYSSMSLADIGKPHDQIARKLRVGIKESLKSSSSFFFIVLDVAPAETLRMLKPGARLEEARTKSRGGFASKWQTAYWFSRYKGAGGSLTPLKQVLADIPGVNVEEIAANMGWLTWSEVFKTVLRAVIGSRA
jgi:hypothetical protein